MEEKILKAIAETLRVDVEMVNKDKAIQDIPQWDSLMFLMILSRLKDEFEIDIPIGEAMEMKKVSDLLAFVVKK